MIQTAKIRKMHRRLLRWYDENARALPWRVDKPYFRWISEIMLQQTRVETVLPYFKRFTKKYPTIQKLAQADPDELRGDWAGLGYYSRVKNIHESSQYHCRKIQWSASRKKRGPRIPSRNLDPYTSAAISSMAFDQAYAAMDGNLERVLAQSCGVSRYCKRSSPINGPGKSLGGVRQPR